MKGCRNDHTIQKGQTETFHYEPNVAMARQDGRKRVAAYCRVSTLMEEQELSFETQKEYYRTLIEKDPTMELVGIYGDQGFSGLHANMRKEFQRLIADCEAEKIDVVLVKSISRFSRNTVECTEYLQRLKEHGVAVMFEKEGLNSMDPHTQMVLSIYSSIAQSESCSSSENIRWAYKQRAKLGNPIRCASYGYRIVKKAGDEFRYWEIDEKPAEHIRFIFDMAYAGYSIREILNAVNRRNEVEGIKPWCYQRVQLALMNEAYRGDLLTNKVVILDYLTMKPVKNRGQVEQFYIEEHHAPIIAPEIFDTVQNYLNQGFLNGKLKRRRAEWLMNNPEILERRAHINGINKDHGKEKTV